MVDDVTNRILLALLCAPLLLAGCGVSDTKQIVEPPPFTISFDGLAFGDSTSIDIVTWNLHNFPSTNLSVEYAAKALRAIDADVVALQEIVVNAEFNVLLDSLPGWTGYRATGASFDQNLALLWNNDEVTIIGEPYEIFTSDWNAFPRSPLVIEIAVREDTLIVINNHLKASEGGDDNIIDFTDTDDNEYRRYIASVMLEEWIRSEHPDDAVIVLGDLNDLLIDTSPNNVFQAMMDRPEQYRFADLSLATGPSSGWSWKYRSHLDHILVTNELFPAVEAAEAEVRTLRLDLYLENYWSEYETNLSDHLPVALKLPL